MKNRDETHQIPSCVKRAVLHLKGFKISWLMMAWKITKLQLIISKIMIQNKMARMGCVKINTWLIK